MNVMIVDIGSNSIKYDIFSPPNAQSIEHRSFVAGLIRYIQNGILSQEGLDILVNTLTAYQKDANDRRIPLYAFATASLRRVSAPEAVIDTVEKRTGIRIELITGELESELSLAGMLQVTPHENTGLMMDMGGGSTELNMFKEEKSIFSVSCPFGALSLKNEFVKDIFPTEDEFSAIKAYTRSVIAKYSEHIRQNTLYMVGGSAKAFAKLLFYKKEEAYRLDNCQFSNEDVTSLIHTLIPISNENILLLKTMFPDRYHLILPAAAAYTALIECCGAKTIWVSPGGIREGYLAHIANRLKGD